MATLFSQRPLFTLAVLASLPSENVIFFGTQEPVLERHKEELVAEKLNVGILGFIHQFLQTLLGDLFGIQEDVGVRFGQLKVGVCHQLSQRGAVAFSPTSLDQSPRYRKLCDELRVG